MAGAARRDESVSVSSPTAGTYYLGLEGVATNTNSYSLLATSDCSVCRFEETDGAFGFSAGWSSYVSGGRSGGSMRYATGAGERMSVGFEGPVVAWVGSRGPNRGIAEVFIDGQSQGLVDLYAPAWSLQQVVFEASGLSAGSHLLEVVVTGTKNPSSGTLHVEVDAIEAAAVS